MARAIAEARCRPHDYPVTSAGASRQTFFFFWWSLRVKVQDLLSAKTFVLLLATHKAFHRQSRVLAWNLPPQPSSTSAGSRVHMSSLRTAQSCIRFNPGHRFLASSDNTQSSTTSSSSSPTPSSSSSSMQSDEEEISVTWDGDEEDLKSYLQSASSTTISFPSYADYVQQLQRCAKSSAYDSMAVAQAEDIFDALYRRYVLTEDATFWPRVDAYNALLECYAFCTSSPTSSTKLEALVKRMEEEENGSNIPKPNAETYVALMDAWIQRKDADRAQAAYDHCLILQPNLVTNVDLYNRLIKAYGMAGDIKHAEQLLNNALQETNDDGDKNDNIPKVRANQKSWVNVLRAYSSLQRQRFHVWSKRPPSKAKDDDMEAFGAEILDKMDGILARMKRGYRRGGNDEWNPTIDAYNALLFAYSYTPGMAKEAESLLFTLLERAKEEAKESSQDDLSWRDRLPTAESFYHVIHAYQLQQAKNKEFRHASVSFKIEQLLQFQDALSEQYPFHVDKLRVLPQSLTAAMDVIGRSADRKKATRAQKILDRLQHHAVDTSDPQMASQYATRLPFAYKLLFNACIYTKDAQDVTDRDRLSAFQIAVQALNEIRGRKHNGVTLDSSITGLFLKACHSLMPPNRKRDAVAQQVFRQACQLGQVNRFVLQQFGCAASDELQLQVLGGFVEDGISIPVEWGQSAPKR